MSIARHGSNYSENLKKGLTRRVLASKTRLRHGKLFLSFGLRDFSEIVSKVYFRAEYPEVFTENDIKYSGRKVGKEKRVKDQLIRLISFEYNFCGDEENKLKAIVVDKQSYVVNTVMLEPDKSEQGNEFLTTLAVWNMLKGHHHLHLERYVIYTGVKGKAAKKSFKGLSENKSQENALLIISAILNISGDIEQNPGPRPRG